MASVADQFYLRGFRHGNLGDLVFAAHLFPYERQIVAGPAYHYMRRGIADYPALSALREVLTQDPGALDIELARGTIETILRSRDGQTKR